LGLEATVLTFSSHQKAELRRFGIIGYPLSHSFSPGYFAAMFQREGVTDCVYESWSIPILDDITRLIEDPTVKGFNVTIPYKTKIMSYLNDISPEASEIGAVNTVTVNDGKLMGYNTDSPAFERTLLETASGFLDGALILGTGGASLAVSYTLKKLGVPFVYVSRRPAEKMLSYEEIYAWILNRFPLIINCTPVGMYPETDHAPKLPYSMLTERNFLYDLVYNPAETKFLAQGKLYGSGIKNGLSMLHYQASLAWQIWNT